MCALGQGVRNLITQGLIQPTNYDTVLYSALLHKILQ